jgi:hypothetical protein
VQSHVLVISGKLAALTDAIEIVTRRPIQGYPIDTARLETKTEEEVLTLAKSVATLRPLVPYPKWRFDADWANPDLAFLLRQRLWQYFNDRRREAPFVTSWHHGTRLCLYMGNDISQQIFVTGWSAKRHHSSIPDASKNDIYTISAAQRVGRD